MNARIVATSLGIVVTGLVWMFTGIERFGREHGNDYEVFAKRTPSLQLMFENPAQCGECDLRPWSLMGPDDHTRFAQYCLARFGLGDEKACYAIFEAKQRAASPPQKSSP